MSAVARVRTVAHKREVGCAGPAHCRQDSHSADVCCRVYQLFFWYNMLHSNGFTEVNKQLGFMVWVACVYLMVERLLSGVTIPIHRTRKKNTQRRSTKHLDQLMSCRTIVA